MTQDSQYKNRILEQINQEQLKTFFFPKTITQIELGPKQRNF